MGTLENSVSESFEAARVAEPAMQQARVVPEVDADEFEVTEAPAAPHGHRPLSSMLSRPEEDELDEPEPEPVVDGAYDWGVKAAERPAGAWLLEDGAEEAARRTVQSSANSSVQGSISGAPQAPPEPVRATPRATPVSAPVSVSVSGPISQAISQAISVPVATPLRDEEPPPPTESMGASGGDARAFLMKKFKVEIASLGPALAHLKAEGRLSPAILGSMDPLEDEDDDDELSVGSFQDHRARGDDAVLSPMQIIEEIRTVRRLHDEASREGLLS